VAALPTSQKERRTLQEARQHHPTTHPPAAGLTAAVPVPAAPHGLFHRREGVGGGEKGPPRPSLPLPNESPAAPPLPAGAGRGSEEEGPRGALCLAAPLPLPRPAAPRLPFATHPTAGGTWPLRAARRAQPETDRETTAPSAPHFPPPAAAILSPAARPLPHRAGHVGGGRAATARPLSAPRRGSGASAGAARP